MMGTPEGTVEDYLLAARALAKLVRGEYPDHYDLYTMAEVWGNQIRPEERAALARVQGKIEEGCSG